ncbi:MAG: hypothetical protein IKY02_05110, partial [Lachnospiraceae bacterium]|nr:hypothetical protein [Lachnospiraceae bacterium]
YSPDTENDAFFVSASTLDSLIQDPAYYSESGGRQRVWYLYFDSFWRMYRFYQEHRSDLNRDLDDYGGRVMLRLQGIPLDYSMKWPMLSRVLLPLSALMVLLTVLFFVNMKRTELAYNNRFIAVFEYAGYGKKEVLRTLVRLSLLEFLAELGIAFGIALVLSLIGNAVNEGLHLLPLSLFSFNPWILGGAIAVIILLAWFYLKYSLSRIRAKSWYELLRETRDLL